jgi:hypothetical protein
MKNENIIFFTHIHIRCGYEVPGMILLHNVKGAMQHDHNKDTSMHVSTYTSHDFNALMPVVWNLKH